MPQQHIVRQGECLSSIARRYGFASWRTIYESGDNAEFRQRRPNPNLIHPGDVLVIPDLAPRREAGATEHRHRFRLHRALTLIRVAVHDEDDAPLAGKRFVLLAGGREVEGQTDGDGVIEQLIEPGDQGGTLTVFATDDDAGPRYLWDVHFGHLDPAEEVSGVQARLNNLGYYCGACDGVVGRLTEAALRAFQEANDLEASGTIDDATRSKLVEVHQV